MSTRQLLSEERLELSTPLDMSESCFDGAAQVPLDVLALVFSYPGVRCRDRGAARLVCRHWRYMIDGLTVRSLVLRSPSCGPGRSASQLLKRFPLLQSLSLGPAVTSNRTAFTDVLSALPSLAQLSSLTLEFPSPSAVRLPTVLHTLSRLQSLSISVVQQGGNKGLLGSIGPGQNRFCYSNTSTLHETGWGAAVGNDDCADDESTSSTATVGQQHRHDADGGSAIGPRVGAWPTSRASEAPGSSSAASAAAAAPPRVTPPGLMPLLTALGPHLTSLELVHLAVSVPEVLAAVRSTTAAATAAPTAGATAKATAAGQLFPSGGGAAAAAGATSSLGGAASAAAGSSGGAHGEGSCGGGSGGGGGGEGCCAGGLRRLVLVGSGVNLTGVNAQEAAAQLMRLEVLTLDACTGADAFMPLLPYMHHVRHLTLAGMDYAWAAAAGYHQRSRADSTPDLNRFILLNDPNIHRLQTNINSSSSYGNQAGRNPAAASSSSAANNEAAVLAAAAAGSGRPLGFLLCLTQQLRSLSLAGSFLRTLPNRDIGGLSALTALDVSGNGLDDLPQGLASLPLLCRLDVSNNELTALPSWLTAMEALESVSCHHNRLEDFPTLLYDIPRLSYISLGHNRISWWHVAPTASSRQDGPAAAATTASSSSPSSQVPLPSLAGSATSTLTHHSQPHPQQSSLHPLPTVSSSASREAATAATAAATPTTASAAAAAAAAAAGDGISGGGGSSCSNARTCSSRSSGSGSLTSLDLSHNRLWGLAGGLGSLQQSLRRLRLRHSLLGFGGAAAARAMGLLATLGELRELDLSSNHLDHHCIAPLSELRQLRRLWLSDNGLEDLPPGFAALSRLTALSLRANRIGEVPNCLRHLPSLEFLDLSCNRLTELPYWIAGADEDDEVEDEGDGGEEEEEEEEDVAYANAGGDDEEDDMNPDNKSNNNNNGCCREPEQQQRQQQRRQRQEGLREHRFQRQQQSEGRKQQPQQRRSSRLRRSRQAGLAGLRHLDVSQQYLVTVSEKSILGGSRLVVHPPHCLYGPLQGDLPEELLLLPYLRTFVVQRHLLGSWSSGVLRKLQARGVEVLYPRPLRLTTLPPSSSPSLTLTAALTAGPGSGLIYPPECHHPSSLASASTSASSAAASRAATAANATAATAAKPQQQQQRNTAAAVYGCRERRQRRRAACGGGWVPVLRRLDLAVGRWVLLLAPAVGCLVVLVEASRLCITVVVLLLLTAFVRLAICTT
ncbi:hypothetical protein Agub_g7566 [Astrephomene gubernaculifera]|uniref:F-box domain-containing protein n=1 Tax=Astrephomene gubernaculifera TaxID=47775 RepID=A0AAD3DSB2_9CHLO|nr:hypothetical protein Agub_g7566 [Astrephomene gubernaculifera]